MFSKNILFLDLGSCYLKGIVVNERKFTILSKQTQLSTGIKNGCIHDSIAFQKDLCALIKALEQKTKKSINATILILGSAIVKYKMLGSNDIKINGIVDKNIINLIDLKIQKWIDDNKSLLIRSTPIEYKIDGTKMLNPIGMYADNIQFLYNIAYAPMNTLGNIVFMLEKHGLNVIDIMPSIYCAAALHLNEDERTLGSLIFDIGSSGINWAFFDKNKPINAGLINFNHENITNKIARSLGINISTARQLKHSNACAILLANHFCTWAEFSKNGNTEHILESEIIRKIIPEVEQLVSSIQKVIHNYNNQAHTAILCGHGAWLNQLNNAVTKNIPISIKLSPSAAPEFDAISGALIQYQIDIQKQEKNIIQRAANWLKENI
jgi:cell division protein FtsA